MPFDGIEIEEGVVLGGMGIRRRVNDDHHRRLRFLRTVGYVCERRRGEFIW